MSPLRNVPFHSYRWNQLKVIPLDSRVRTGNDFHPVLIQLTVIVIQLVAASRRELLTLLIYSRRVATILDIALLLSLV